MFKKIDHIGIAVKDIKEANKLFEELSQTGLLKTENVENEGVTTSFFQVGETKVEFIKALDETSAIAKFIEKNGEGLHHIAFEVDNINDEIKRLQAAGFEFVSTEPKRGADDKLVCFLHPRSTNRVLIELCQSIS